MIPDSMSGRESRANIPMGVMVGGVIVLIGLVFFGWIAMGMRHAPTPEATTLDVPLAR